MQDTKTALQMQERADNGIKIPIVKGVATSELIKEFCSRHPEDDKAWLARLVAHLLAVVGAKNERGKLYDFATVRDTISGRTYSDDVYRAIRYVCHLSKKYDGLHFGQEELHREIVKQHL